MGFLDKIRGAAEKVGGIVDFADDLTGGNIQALSLGNQMLKSIIEDEEDTRLYVKDLSNNELREFAHACVDELADR